VETNVKFNELTADRPTELKLKVPFSWNVWQCHNPAQNTEALSYTARKTSKLPVLGILMNCSNDWLLNQYPYNVPVFLDVT